MAAPWPTSTPISRSSSAGSVVHIYSPEYNTFRRCHFTLVDLLKVSIGRIGDVLFAKGHIPPEVKDEIQETNGRTAAEKARKVIGCLTNRIKHNPAVYHEFVDILKQEGQWTQLIVEKLTSEYFFPSAFPSMRVEFEGSYTGTNGAVYAPCLPMAMANSQVRQYMQLNLYIGICMHACN